MTRTPSPRVLHLFIQTCLLKTFSLHGPASDLQI